MSHLTLYCAIPALVYASPRRYAHVSFPSLFAFAATRVTRRPRPQVQAGHELWAHRTQSTVTRQASFVDVTGDLSASLRREKTGRVFLGPFLSSFLYTRVRSQQDEHYLSPQCDFSQQISFEPDAQRPLSFFPQNLLTVCRKLYGLTFLSLSTESSGFATGMPGGGPSSTNFGVESSTTGAFSLCCSFSHSCSDPRIPSPSRTFSSSCKSKFSLCSL